MSDNFETTSPSGSGTPPYDTGTQPHGTPQPSGAPAQPTDSHGKVDAAKHEASDLKDSAAGHAKDVLHAAKDEASSVVGEAKMQAKDLYAQTQRELRDQANTQQQRLATGLRSVGDDLESMATNSSGTGIAADLVQQASGRVSAAASWLGERDPGSVLNEVKRYARRKPGTFILAAAIGGVVIGRLTRALASDASDHSGASAQKRPAMQTPPAPPAPPAPPVPPMTQVHPDQPTPVGGPSAAGAEPPLYTETRSSRADASGEGGYDRPHTI
ncbi:hypothetical protein PQI51_01760 [Microbacterium esteraromaticum]|uniref:hypothetical protein n=1 Tax=Microbacterium esteraromaticum TaxID=57043 RepID=UPI0030958424